MTMTGDPQAARSLSPNEAPFRKGPPGALTAAAAGEGGDAIARNRIGAGDRNVGDPGGGACTITDRQCAKRIADGTG